MTDLVPLSPEPVALDAKVDLLAKYNECTRAIKYWDGELSRVKEELTKLLGDAEEGTIEGRVVVTHKPIDRFNEGAFKKLYPDMHRLYTRELTKVAFDVESFRISRPELFEQFKVKTFRNEFNG